MNAVNVRQLQKQISAMISTPDVAEAFGKTNMTIFNWRMYRGLPCIVVPHRARRPIILFEKTAVVRWARLHNVPIVDESKLLY